MASKVRSFTKGFLLFLNAVAALLFLLACLAPSVDPDRWWFISVLGLGFPILLVIVILFLAGWLFVKRRLALISAIALLLGIRSISIFFAFHPSGEKASAEGRKNSSLRLATWNVARFIEMKRNNNKGSQTRLRMMEQIQQTDADIICLQEFFHSQASDYYPNLTYISKHFNYPYYFFSHDDDGDKHFTGSVIFFPLSDHRQRADPLSPTNPARCIDAC